MNIRITITKIIPALKAIGGYSLVEMLVVIAVATVLFLGTNVLFVTVIRTPTQQLSQTNNIDQARKVLSSFTNELRNGAAGNDGSYQLSTAGDTQIVFYTNYGASGTAVNRVRYYLSGTTLYRGVVIPTGSPLTYNLGTETVKPVQTNLANGATPIFYYYDDTYSGTSNPLVQPVNLTQVKFAKINLIIKKQNTVTDTSTFTIDGGAAIRSLKTNLGN